jgi:hypothetical protein
MRIQRLARGIDQQLDTTRWIGRPTAPGGTGKTGRWPHFVFMPAAAASAWRRDDRHLHPFHCSMSAACLRTAAGGHDEPSLHQGIR